MPELNPHLTSALENINAAQDDFLALQNPPSPRKLHLLTTNWPTPDCKSWAENNNITLARHIHHRHLHTTEDPYLFNPALFNAELDRLRRLNRITDDTILIPNWEDWRVYEDSSHPNRPQLLKALTELSLHCHSIWGYPRVYQNQRASGVNDINKDIELVLGHLQFSSPALYLKAPFDSDDEVWSFRAWVAMTKALCDAHDIDCVPQIILRCYTPGTYYLNPFPMATLKIVRRVLLDLGVTRACVWSQDHDEVNAGRLHLTKKEMTDEWVSGMIRLLHG